MKYPTINNINLQKGLQLEYTSSIDGHYWTGAAKIPEIYFPRQTNKFNAYAIHGSGNTRRYEALFPVPFQKFENPDL